jgi:nucleotide-binding universal stress UspA family protein
MRELGINVMEIIAGFAVFYGHCSCCFPLYKTTIMKILLAPTDFSPASINAVNYAADLALATGASLHLLHVYQLPLSVTETPLPLTSIDELREGAEKRLLELRNDLEHITSGKLNIMHDARFGLVVDEIDEACKQINPSAVIMGTTGYSGIEKVLFGSTTQSAIKVLTWPVICVPKGTEYGKGIQKVGLATDLLNVEETIPFEHIASFVKQLNAELHVLHVETEERKSPGPEIEETAILGTAIKELDPKFHFIKHDNVEEGIEEFSEENNLDLIIVVPKKHNFAERLFSKSAAKKIMRESHIPVMSVHE